jgi:SWI/SNF-related matrix-associated actin-dependent regulator 1 of chromatin subfamily A
VDCQVARLSIGAANSGLTLTAAHTMLFASLHWVPSEICQAEDRCHRIGQENKVDIRYVIAKGTIDDKMFAKINRKLSVTNSILNADTDDGVGFSGEVVEFERRCSEVEEKQSQPSNDPTVSPVDALTTLDPLGLF